MDLIPVFSKHVIIKKHTEISIVALYTVLDGVELQSRNTGEPFPIALNYNFSLLDFILDMP